MFSIKSKGLSHERVVSIAKNENGFAVQFFVKIQNVLKCTGHLNNSVRHFMNR